MLRNLALVSLVVLLAGCVAQSRGAPRSWYGAHNAVAPRELRVSVCHGFGCQLKTSVAFGAGDVRTMAKKIGPAKTPEAERAGIRRAIAWMETRVAPEVGSENDVGGLDLHNAGVAGQMDCIDEATNTTSYLLIFEQQGLLKHHEVSKPVARGFFLDGRYPHATATIVDGEGTAWAVDSWPHRNGALPDVMTLEKWFSIYPWS